MTSVPNHRLQLNGSSIAACFLMLCFLFSCTAPKAVSKKPSDPKPTSKDTSEKVRVYDPATGTYVLVPKEGSKVDTVKWTEDKSDPVLTDRGTVDDTPEKKSNYEISLLVPLNSDQYTSLDGHLDSKLIRFMQYYGGMRIAADDVQEMGLPVKFRSYDTDAISSGINELLRDPAIRRSDVIVGPYEKEDVELVASFGLQNEKFIVSPWLPAFNIDSENPYFIQAIPGLNTHADAIMDFIDRSYDPWKIFLVARNNPTEIQRLALFKKNTGVRTEDLIIDDESIDLSKTNLNFLLDDPDGTVFVMPYYSRSDEDFVSSFMRKLHADKGTKKVIVFGLPQWTGFNNLNSDYMESLSLHISSPTHVDSDHSGYQSFRNKFFHKYFTMPDNQAYQGYDLVMWLAKTISKEGPGGLIKGLPSEFGISSGYSLKPVFREGAKKPSEMKTPLYYENSKVRILKFRDQDFVMIR